MKNLKDILVEKLKVDDITFDKFTRELTAKDMSVREFVKYLKNCGFEEKKYQNNKSVLDDVKDFNTYKGRYYSYSIRSWAETPEIVFADTSKDIISKNNPLYYLEYAHETRIRKMVKGVGLEPSSDFSSIVNNHDILVELKDYFEKI